MKVGVGLSKLKEPELAIQEAYRKSLQKIGSTKSDLCFVFYSYDYGMDSGLLGATIRKVLRDVPHLGCSTWSAWSSRDAFEGETGMMVVSFKELGFDFDFYKIHSLREKAEIWSAEVVRRATDVSEASGKSIESLFLFADSLNFTPGSGFNYLERHLPHVQSLGMGTSFSVPQCSVICDGEVFSNAMVGMSFSGIKPWVGIIQSVRPELKPITINRMSENLIIEMDNKPAFYKLCEHLMTQDDLPMMSPDEFRKHMGNLYIIEQTKTPFERPRLVGDSYRVISLLGSEMTTGMVAVANGLDFSQTHYLGQKKAIYAEAEAQKVLDSLKTKVPHPSMVWTFCSAARIRDRDRTTSDFEMIQKTFPDVPVIGVATNGEFLGGSNQFATLLMVFP